MGEGEAAELETAASLASALTREATCRLVGVINRAGQRAE